MSDSDAEDDFVMYGTALDPIEEDDVKRKKPTPIEEQIVTDEQGRRRFHGAFTGGFSAGFFNSVGSRDGWSPATFKSSRSDRKSGRQLQRPEDFMDAEDVGEFGFAPKGVTATDSFQAQSQVTKQQENKRRRLEATTEVIPGASFLEDIITPVRDSKGMLLLRKMGWKAGQGVGPRLRPKEKRKPDDAEEPGRTYGCFIPEEFRRRGDDEGEELELTFAPDDVKAWTLVPKKDLFGLGYTGLSRGNVLGGEATKGPRLVMREKGNRRVAITGQAFGVGAFEEDDDDIYSTEDLSMYDFEMRADAEKAKAKARAVNKADPYKKFEGDDVPGFVLSRATVVPRIFRPPPISPDYKPGFRVYPACKGMREPAACRWDVPPDAKTETSSTKPGLGRHTMTIAERGEALGEKPVVKMVVEKIVIRPERKAPEEPQKALVPVKPAQPGASKFRPFEKDEAKQRRYEQYLVLRRNKCADKLSELQPPDMPEWEREEEKAMFERAATVYEPLNTAIMSRFVSGGNTAALAEPELEEDMKAAKAKMYGKLTRVTIDWCPGDLLCRRFNVKNPHPSCKEAQEVDEGKDKKEKRSLFGFLLGENPPPVDPDAPEPADEEIAVAHGKEEPATMEEREGPILHADAEVRPVTRQPAERPAEEEPEVADEQKTEEAKPSIDLFRAIFDDSDEGEDEETTEEPAKKVEAGRSPVQPQLTSSSTFEHRLGPSPPPVDVKQTSEREERSTSRRREEKPDEEEAQSSGIFANLNLKELEEKWKARTKALFEQKNDRTKATSKQNPPEVETYGPALPTTSTSKRYTGSDESSSDSSTDSSDSEEERRSRRKRHSRKKDRSRKDKKKKKDKKKSKNHKHKSSRRS